MSSQILNRRRFLFLSGGGLAALAAAYAYGRGVRYPLLGFAGTGPTVAASAGGAEVTAQGAVFQEVRQDAFRFRAFVPEPAFAVRGDRGAEVRIVIENLHTEAALDVKPSPSFPVSEDRDGLTRSLVLTAAPAKRRFAWRFPRPEAYRFAAIGDTGGGAELHWVLERAAELGADFLIHLGDIYYEDGDFERAAANLNGAAIPTYATIGNHDFHDGWRPVYPRFHRVVGPSNTGFTLGGIEFVGFDTAADFIPVARGRRAQLLENLRPVDTGAGIRDRVAFTHMPLRDPQEGRSHAVGRDAEAQWLRSRLLASGTRNLLVGHIHIKEEFDDQGLRTYITGQGLGHADLIGDGPYRRFAEILLGDVGPGEPVRYQWRPLNMPFEAHCNARNFKVLDVMDRPEVKAKLLAACGK